MILGYQAKLKAFYPGMFICSVLIRAVGLGGVLARRSLIDAIAYGESRTLVGNALAVLLLLILFESVLNLAYRYFELNCTRKYALEVPELLADRCDRLPLCVVERKETAETVFASKEYFAKSLEATKGLTQFADLTLTLGLLVAQRKVE